MSTDGDTARALISTARYPGVTPCSVKLVLIGAAIAAVLYATTRALWQGESAELGAGLAMVVAAVCAGSAGVIEAIDRARPRPISKDNGAPRAEGKEE